jgi:hypothetical protein
MEKRPTKDSSILNFFAKRAKLHDDVQAEIASATTTDASEVTGPDQAREGMGQELALPETGHEISPLPTPELELNARSVYDIGLFVGKCPTEIPEGTKYRLICNCWKPDANYKFPSTSQQGRNRSFVYRWINADTDPPPYPEFLPWLAYSEELGGALCKVCVLFAAEVGGKGKHQCLGTLVNKPYTDYKDAVANFRLHLNTQYHKDAALRAEHFCKVYSGQEEDIRNVICNRRKQTVEES